MLVHFALVLLDHVANELTVYKSGTVNSKSFVGKGFLRNKWKYELTVHFKHAMIGK